jgi:hypothetical protein
MAEYGIIRRQQQKWTSNWKPGDISALDEDILLFDSDGQVAF